MKHHRPTILARSLAIAFAGATTIITLPAMAEDDVVNVVEVTAQSRHQLISDVPIAIQVITAKDIQTLGAKDLSEMNGYIPGFTADNSEPTEPTFTIRGVQGGGDFGIGTDSPVGIYEDGVYTGKTGGAMMNFVDVQRIEVIKGPQGTLFGRNSAAGAISIVTNEPTQDVDALLHYTIGNFGTHKGDLMFNAPLSDTTAVRFVVTRIGSKGWVKNETTGNEVGDNSDWATRLSLKQSFGKAKVVFAWEHEELSQDARPAFGVITNPALPLGSTIPNIINNPTTPLTGGFTGVYNAAYVANFANPLHTPLVSSDQGSESRKFDGLTLRAEVPVGDLTFNSTTGYRLFTTWDATDNSGTNNPYTAISTLDAKKSRSIQQEFKLSGKNNAMDWISGLSFYNNSERQISGASANTGTIDTLNLLQGGSPAQTFAALFAGLGAGGVPGASAATTFPWAENTYSNTDTQAWSLYGDTIWHLDTKSNLTFGMRWSEDKKTMTWYTPPRQSQQFDQFLNSYGQYVPPSSNGPFTPASFPPNIVFSTEAATSSTPISSTKSWTNLSPRLVLDHKYDKDTMVFASLSQGYQAGGFNVFTPPNPASPNPSQRDPSYSPEKMTNLELGLKKTLPEINGSLNTSLFAYRFNNLQNISLTGAPGTVPTYNVTTSDQKAVGLDADGRFKPVSNVTVFAGMEYIDATFTKYDEVGTSGTTTNLAGQPVGTPLWTAMAGTNMTWNALNGHIDWTFEGNYTGATRRCSDAPGLQCLDYANIHSGAAMTKADTRLGWLNATRQFGVSVVVNNVFDKRYVTSLGGQLTSIGVPYATINPPRFVGIEFTASM